MALPANSIYQGDCIRRLQELSADSIDLVFADPPFNIGYDYDVYDDEKTSEDYLSWTEKWMRGVHRGLKPSGSFWLAIGDEYAAELKLIAQREVGFHCRSWVIWYYTFGVNCRNGFSRSHTHLFHFVKDPKQFTFNAENPAVRVPSARQLVYADSRANGKGRLPDNTWILRPQDAPEPAFHALHDTWYFARVAGTFKEREGFHGCQMPEQLLGRIIRVSSNPGELVLDPFGGSGTTLAVAKKLGRQWLGFELSAEYVQRIQDRLNSCHSGDPLDGAADPLRSAPATSKGKRRVRLRKGRTVPVMDDELRQGIIDAYSESSAGHSADVMLCDPAYNARFVEECQARNLPGNAGTWNRFLLRIRKRGQLPRLTPDDSSSRSKQLSIAAMDPFSAASEVALQFIRLDFDLTLDELLCSPDWAHRFDALAAQFADGYTSFEYRWAALATRKRARTAKQAASELAATWSVRQLASAKPLESCVSDKFARPGVYVLLSHRQPLYVGATCDIRRRVEQVQTEPAWQALEPTAIRLVSNKSLSGGKSRQRHGCQSLLIEKFDPLLNCSLLRPTLPTQRAAAAV